jgi:putative endonuclease
MNKKKEKKYFVYILECFDGNFYTGVCVDLKKRLRQHNGEILGGAKYTKYRRPVKIIYFEELKNRSEAQIRESEIKKFSKDKKKDLVGGFLGKFDCKK